MLREQDGELKTEPWSPFMTHAAAAVESEDWSSAFRRAARRLIKVSSLETFIAQNPWAGYEDRPMSEVDGVMRRYGQGGVWMPLSFYQQEFERGRIRREDLEAVLADEVAAGRTGIALETLLTAQSTPQQTPQGPHLWPRLLRELPTPEQRAIERTILRWFQAYYDEHHAVWIPPRADRSLWNSWKHLAQWDFSLEPSLGEELRRLCRGLPERASEAIAAALANVQVPATMREAYLTGHLYRYPGWAGYLRYRDEEGSWVQNKTPLDGELVDMLAILLVYEVALLRVRSRTMGRDPNWNAWVTPGERDEGDDPIRQLWHAAYERRFHRDILQHRPLRSKAETRYEAQAVFCIDVRSEALRRRWEATGAYRGYGFAGFFGVPLEVHAAEAPTKKLYPAIVVPNQTIRWQVRPPRAQQSLRRTAKKMLKYLLWSRMPAASAFGFIELFGYTYSSGFLQRWFEAWGLSSPSPRATPVHSHELGSHCQSAAFSVRLAVAQAVLSCLGDPKELAPLVVLLGHGAQGTNNPFASALQCGACGGHAGGINARLAATILNDPTVRQNLAEQGLSIPSDTWFVAGEHRTTEQSVELYEDDSLPASHRSTWQRLRDNFASASAALAESQAQGRDYRPALGRSRRLAQDWSALRPEWGLSGHALFVIGFDRAQHQQWAESRFFLHSYEPGRDPEGLQLRGILAGPVLVAADINLHYYGASLAVVSSGDKMLHTVTGRMGILEGPWGDLRYGLPQQSLSWNGRVVHEPLRLTVLIEAAQRTMDGILASETRLRRLVEGGWLQMIVWDASQGAYYACRGVGHWTRMTSTEEVPAEFGTHASLGKSGDTRHGLHI